MKAISLPAPRQVRVVELPEPRPGLEEVLIDVHYVGLCGSDLGLYRGTFALGSYPRVPGHEVSGIIAGRGANVPDAIRVGDRVTLSPYSACGMCPACRVGRPNCCQFNETLGLQRDGCLSERFAIHYTQVYGTRSLSLPELALVEPMSVGYHAANRGRVSEVDTVLVIGCGTVGIGAVAASARKGAMVIAVDVDDAKLALATRFGAQHTINASGREVADEVARLTEGEGVRVAIEAVGLPQTFRLAVEVTCFAGRVVYVGYAKEQVCYDTTLFVRKELEIYGSRNALRAFPGVIGMMEQGQQPFDELVSRVYALEETGQALVDWDADPTRYTKILIDARPDRSDG